MPLLDFTKPAKVEVDGGFDGAHSDGGYTPQMSDADARRWKAKKFNISKPNARIELRKSFERNATQIFIIVALDGWDLSSKNEHRNEPAKQGWGYMNTAGLNVRMSMNGSLLLTFDDWSEINQIVQEAKEYIESNK
jgi:hypothetical protein